MDSGVGKGSVKAASSKCQQRWDAVSSEGFSFESTSTIEMPSLSRIVRPAAPAEPPPRPKDQPVGRNATQPVKRPPLARTISRSFGARRWAIGTTRQRVVARSVVRSAHVSGGRSMHSSSRAFGRSTPIVTPHCRATSRKTRSLPARHRRALAG